MSIQHKYLYIIKFHSAWLVAMVFSYISSSTSSSNLEKYEFIFFIIQC